MDIRTISSGSSGNCYYIGGNTPLLLDCGIPIKRIQQALNFKLTSVAGCLISHSHQDHCASVNKLMQAGIDCYMSAATAEALCVSGYRAKIIEPRRIIRIGEWTCMAFDLQHDVPNLGFMLANSQGEKLVYITDSYYCKYKFSGITHLLIECNHSYEILDRNVESGALPMAMKKRLIQSHFSLERVKEFLQANDLSQVSEIHLIHLSNGNSDAALFKREVKQLTGIPTYIAGE